MRTPSVSRLSVGWRCSCLRPQRRLRYGTRDPRDPLEPMNRSIYQFNDHFDRVLLKPAAILYNTTVPPPVRGGVTNFFGNFRDVTTAVNNLLQAKFKCGGLRRRPRARQQHRRDLRRLRRRLPHRSAETYRGLRTDAGGLGHARRTLPRSADSRPEHGARQRRADRRLLHRSRVLSVQRSARNLYRVHHAHRERARRSARRRADLRGGGDRPLCVLARCLSAAPAQSDQRRTGPARRQRAGHARHRKTLKEMEEELDAEPPAPAKDR